ncbi:distal tail protein Dit [Bacillus toyonensis]|uniref:distal tail protein Dit n=1 Tax=Bacillus toyonensis TaxID=155322 RepID=UPI000BF2D695|nr:distal tail protein Dit [Bacillus toyonensis]PGB38788.1 phage tail protein [Bacillus toyonensis]
MRSFIFNGQRRNYIATGQGWKKPAWAPLKRNLLQVSNYPGARLLNTQTDIRVLPVSVGIEAKSSTDLETLKEDLARWLITEEPQELIFDAEPDRTYFAIVDESFDPDELVNIGQGVVKFICPMPYKLGLVRNAKAKLEQNNIIKIDVLNEGSVFSEPKFKIQVENPSTFIDIINKKGNQLFRLGYPVKVDETPISRYELVMHDKANSLVGWTEVGKDFVSDYGIVAGKMIADGARIMPSDYGQGQFWHGPAVKRSITGGPLQDFTLDAIVECRNLNPATMGRVELYLLDENSVVVGKVGMFDAYRNSSENFGEVMAGNGDYNHLIIAETGYYRSTWNDFYGRLHIARVGNYWQGDIALLDEKGNYHTEKFAQWWDTGNSFMKKVAQIVVHICSFSDAPSLTAAVHDIKVQKVNSNTERQKPYIVQKGDLVEIDSSDASIRINGADAINIKNFMSDYIRIEKGKNEIEIFPNNIGQVDVTYRERYR